MSRFLLRRILLTVPTVLLVIWITFTLGFYAPGDPVVLMFGQQPVNEAVLQRLRHQYGLDRPYPVQLADYARKVARGDFGESLSLNRPVGAAIAAAIPISAQIGLAALLLIAIIGIPLGVIAALKHNSLLDYGAITGVVILQAIPPFVLAPLLMILLVLKLGWLSSTTGWAGLFSVKAILPVAALTLGSLVGVVRYTRAGVISALKQDYVVTARAKGLSTRQIIVRHVLRNALTPVLTSLGLSVGGLITGSIFLEDIFGIPGFGSLAVGAIRSSDYPLILGTTIVGALIVIGANLLVDILYGVLDPRVRSTR